MKGLLLCLILLFTGSITAYCDSGDGVETLGGNGEGQAMVVGYISTTQGEVQILISG